MLASKIPYLEKFTLCIVFAHYQKMDYDQLIETSRVFLNLAQENVLLSTFFWKKKNESFKLQNRNSL